MLTAVCTENSNPLYGRTVRLLNAAGMHVAFIQTGVTQCCGLNTLQGMALSLLDSSEKVKRFFDDLSTSPWNNPKSGPPPHYTMKHFIFTCGMGKSGPYIREEGYKYLIADPRVKLISRVPSASEPEEGHDIGIFLLDLS